MPISLEKLYQTSPIWGQNFATSAFGWHLKQRRYTADYLRLEQEVFARLSLDQQAWRALAHRRLQAMVAHAARSTSYYKKVFADLGADYRDIRSSEDLKGLPTLSKQEAQSCLTELRSRDASRMMTSTWKTSGTTGTALVFPMSLRGEQEQWAMWWRYRSQFGLDRNTWYAHFYGKTIVPVQQQKAPFWRVNQPGRQILFSGYHMRDENLPAYVSELNHRQPPWIQGYPSLLALLAGFIVTSNHRLDYQPKMITTGAETLLPQQRSLIEKAFDAPCRQHYGTTEAVANISECPNGYLHVDEDFGLVEFLPVGDGVYRMVATGYANKAFPLLRYEIGDNVVLPASPIRCNCGHPGQIVESIDGRIEDYVISATGSRVGRLDHILKDFVNIRECQIVQNRPGEITFLVVPGPSYDREEASRLISEGRKRLGRDMKIGVEYASELQRGPTGKLRFVISNVKQTDAARRDESVRRAGTIGNSSAS